MKGLNTIACLCIEYKIMYVKRIKNQVAFDP